MSTEGISIRPLSYCYTVLYSLRGCYDKVKELAIRLFEYISSVFKPRQQVNLIHIPIVELPCFPRPLSPIPESPIHIAIDLRPEEESLSTDDLDPIQLAATPPSAPGTPISISSVIDHRLRQDSPDTIIREVLESMAVTPIEERMTITITSPETIHRISPSASVTSVDSTGWVIEPD